MRDNATDALCFAAASQSVRCGTRGGEDKSTPSFKRYIAKHQPEYTLRFIKRGYKKDGCITNLPLYLAGKHVITPSKFK